MLKNKRVDPRNPDDIEWGDLTTETKPCVEFTELPGRFGIRTLEIFNPSEIDVFLNAGPTELERITEGDPTTGQFYADGGSGYIFLHPSHLGSNIKADYYPGGSILTAEVLASDEFKGPQGEKGDDGDTGAQGPAGNVSNAPLTGYVVGPNSDVAATDTVLEAFGKVQGQIDAGLTPIADQIHAAASKTPPVDADELGVADSDASFGLKKLTFANLFLWIVSKIYGLTGKTTPADADQFLITDSAASNVGKSLTWANIKAAFKTYFDTLYLPIAWDVAWDTIAGVGATDTNKIVYFTNKNTDTSGGNLTIVNNSTNGLRLTIVTSGVYTVGFWLAPTGGSLTLGVSLNSNQLTTNVESITAANRLCLGSAPQNFATFVSATKKLSAGDVIRAHIGTGGAGNGNNANSGFFITRIS